MREVNYKQFEQLINDWYLFGRPRPKPSIDSGFSQESNKSLGSAQNPADALAKKSKTVLVENRKFILTEKFVDATGYDVALGYYQDPDGNFHCRHFYRSNSESFWRVGTGFRANKAWVKGAEGHGADMPGGYIFEGQVHHQLDRALRDMDATLRAQSLGDIWLYKAAALGLADEYMVAPENSYSDVVDEYAKERVKINVLTQDLKRYKVPYSANQVLFQERVQSKEERIQGYSDIADRLKLNSTLWRFVEKCLENHVDSYGFHHSILGCECTVYRYRLLVNEGLNVIVEIAASKRMNLQFRTNSGIPCSSNSPICWVKSVYIEEGVSTYGNYAKYPEDLCFLVQKPIDYAVQLGSEVQHRVGQGFGVAEQRFSENQTKDGRYISLFLYNEKYSPLVVAFKKSRGYPLFKLGSRKFVSSEVVKILEQIQREDFEALKRSMPNAFAFCSARYGGSDNGREIRSHVARLSRAVHEINDYRNLNFFLYNLFMGGPVASTRLLLPEYSTERIAVVRALWNQLQSVYFEIDCMFDAACNQGNDEIYEQYFDELYARYSGREHVETAALERLALHAVRARLFQSHSDFTNEQCSELIQAICAELPVEGG